jgi:NADPH-dependent glutamate synthase beta subunit-like oxidoreductase/NAD(P)H-flavin reductase
MTGTAAIRESLRPSPLPGLPGWTWTDLHDPLALARLHGEFLRRLEADDPALSARFAAYRERSGQGKTAEDSAVLVAVAKYVSSFVAALFGIEAERDALRRALDREGNVARLRGEFFQRRVFRKGAADRPTADDFPELDRRARALLAHLAPGAVDGTDPEDAFAALVAELLDLQKAAGKKPRPAAIDLPEVVRAGLERVAGAALAAGIEGTDHVARLEGVLAFLDRWCFARTLHPEGRAAIAGWVSYRLPHKWDLDRLVDLRRPDPARPELIEGPVEHRRRRDGFALTDPRGSRREVQVEAAYCLRCHEREKDSCTRGFPEKEPAADGRRPFQKNPLGIPLTGCPLDEHISEMQDLARQGDPLAAVAVISIANPMAPGTGHRICNDCMKSCVYQTQNPVNIPMVETGALTEVLKLPWGFEIWSLLTRWNPLHVKRPYPLPYNGKRVLVVGMGPAGYTLAHHLLNEGFGVVGVDGLKIEPLPEAWLAGPIRDWNELCRPLDRRVPGGFGGVSEYGITVRWDKNFLAVLELNLLRRRNFALYGGVRFGGTLTVEDAWALGFDHVALAAGAGKPTLIGLENNLLPGIRKASDFLMALQLSGAFRDDSLANLLVRLPVVVIGGGLTAIDAATESAAYYPVQVEKLLARWEILAATPGADPLRTLAADERALLEEMLEHGRAVRAERARAAAAGEAPDFASLVRKWGGVKMVYRKSLHDSPAYRLNHEEVVKGLEEGIEIVEGLGPVAALPDDRGFVKAMRFEKQVVVDGRWKGTGETVELPARTVLVAAGTSPNVTYEKEHGGTFALDNRGNFFATHRARRNGDGTLAIEPSANFADLSGEAGFFTSYLSPDRTRCVSFYGDNHPQYAGSVVKAMASGLDGHEQVVRLFAGELARLDPAEQALRDAEWSSFRARLDDVLRARVVEVKRLTRTIVEVTLRAPFAASHFEPGQFYRLQTFESTSPVVDGTRLAPEGMALTGAWVDKEQGLLSLIVLEMGGSSRLCATLRPGQEVVCMGPTGAPTEIPRGETVLLLGGGLGNAVLFSIAKALRENGNRVLYVAGYKDPGDLFKRDEIEAATDQVIWAVDRGEAIAPRRSQDRSFVGNIVEAVVAHAEGRLGEPVVRVQEVDRIIAIGSDRMMAAVKEARRGVLRPYLKAEHVALGSINSPMQCMMKEICAQCLQRHVGPDGKETFVFTCMNQDQPLDAVDFPFLNLRLRQNGLQEKVANLWLERLFHLSGIERV